MKTLLISITLVMSFQIPSFAQIYDLDNGKETITLRYETPSNENGPVVQFQFRYIPYKYLDSYRIGYTLISSSFKFLGYRYEGQSYLPSQIDANVLSDLDYSKALVSLTADIYYYNRFVVKKDFISIQKDQQMGAAAQSDGVGEEILGQNFKVEKEDWMRGIVLKNLKVKEFGSTYENMKIEKYLAEKVKDVKVKSYIKKGDDYLAQGYADRAKTAFNEAIKFDPKNQEALAKLERIKEIENRQSQTTTDLSVLSGKDAQSSVSPSTTYSEPSPSETSSSSTTNTNFDVNSYLQAQDEMMQSKLETNQVIVDASVELFGVVYSLFAEKKERKRLEEQQKREEQWRKEEAERIAEQNKKSTLAKFASGMVNPFLLDNPNDNTSNKNLDSAEANFISAKNKLSTGYYKEGQVLLEKSLELVDNENCQAFGIIHYYLTPIYLNY